MAPGENMCGICNKDEATTSCSECGIPLCGLCVKEIPIEEISPESTFKGMSTTILRPAVSKKHVCSKCMKEADLY